MKIKKSYKFAIKSSSFLAVLTFILASSFSYIFYQSPHLLFSLSIAIAFFILSFFIIQFRVEKFIYKRVKNIYDEVSLLDVSELNKKSNYF